MTKHVASTTKKFLAAGGLAFGVGSLGLFASAGAAAADLLDDCQTYDTSSLPADPSWPGGAILDEDGFESYITSSFPATSSYPG